MNVPDHLSVADVLELHDVLIQRFGGAAGLRDAAALDAAVARPRSGYYADVVAAAAALFESLAVNHPFVDGNKRIAFAAADVTLRINGWRLQREPMRIHGELMEMFAESTLDFAHLEPWFRSFAVAEDAHPTNR